LVRAEECGIHQGKHVVQGKRVVAAMAAKQANANLPLPISRDRIRLDGSCPRVLAAPVDHSPPLIFTE
jgi:hypothetical protein